MGNCVFSYPDYTLDATLSQVAGSGTWTNLNNLINPLRGKVASCVPTSNVSVFRCDLGSAKPLQVFAVIGHNLSINATIRITTATSNAYGVAGDTGTVAVYGGSPAITAAELATYRVKPDFYIVLANPYNHQYIQVTIADTGNPSLITLGRFFAGPKYSPEINLDYGASFGWEQQTQKETSMGGTDWISVLSQGRSISGNFGGMTNSDSQALMNRQQTLGTSGELYFILNPNAVTGIDKTQAMLCRFEGENPLVLAAFGYSTNSFKLKEIR